MDKEIKNKIKDIKKHKPRGVGFFAFAIVLGSIVNIVNSVQLLRIIMATEVESITATAIDAMGINVLQSTVFVVFGLIIFIVKLPVAMRLWEFREWGRKMAILLAALSIAMVITTFAISALSQINRPTIRIFFILEGIVLNILLIWYFSTDKIRAAFVK